METKISDVIGGILGIVLLVVMGWWIFNIVFPNDMNNKSRTSECGDGYHMEGYTTPYGETITECFKN